MGRTACQRRNREALLAALSFAISLLPFCHCQFIPAAPRPAPPASVGPPPGQPLPVATPIRPNTFFGPVINNSPYPNIYDLFLPQPVGAAERGQPMNTRINAYDLARLNWLTIDRRAEDGWWHLYPFGEKYYDVDVIERPWKEAQIDLDFYFPYFGFRFNYTFIFPEGFIAFSYPWYIQPPFTFPNPRWPDDPDPSIIATFMSAQTPMFVGDTGISHVWYRLVTRPFPLIGDRIDAYLNNRPDQNYFGKQDALYRRPDGMPSRTSWGREILKIQPGRVEDPAFLDTITEDIQTGMVGARGFTADFALIVTWERMGYGGAPKVTQVDQYDWVKRWQNTYQLVIATDEIRSFTIFNYGNINWTSSTAAGSLAGRGGKQSAIVGFNGGNGTGYFEMPYSAEGNSFYLVRYGSTQIAGRWLARVDETIEYGGCTNTSTGILRTHVPHGSMLGGFALNVSGPCLRTSDVIKLQIDDINMDCTRLDMVIARCVVPANALFRHGMVDIKLSVDGGKEYRFWNKFYLLSPSRNRREIKLIDDPVIAKNNWKNPWAENLTIVWSNFNLSLDYNAQVDVMLWGYWEDLDEHDFNEVGSIMRGSPNKGSYFFNPKALIRTDMMPKAHRKYFFGSVQVRISMSSWGGASLTNGDGLYWSELVPFGWYFLDAWEYEYGRHWPLQKCIEWFEWDGKRDNFYRYLEPKLPCPCTLNQAFLDMGRFFPMMDCDRDGDSQCYYTKGAYHCVTSTVAVWTGSAQQCCYDMNGWLMFSQDWEYNKDYLRFFSPGVPQRSHPFGAYPWRRPSYVPSLSNFHNDLMPYEFCCKWSAHCELFGASSSVNLDYWRRETSGCIAYEPPVSGYAYGEPHFVTYDGTKYTFNGKGYFVLTSMKSSRHDLMVQIRMEEPPKTLWNEWAKASVITGVAAQDNDSAIVQVFARREFRDWRYKMDVFINGIQVWFDTPWQKIQHFVGVTLFSPARNMNCSEIRIMFSTGAGVRVQEARGLLDVMVLLTSDYNESLPYQYGSYSSVNVSTSMVPKCNRVRTLGLLGTFNNNPFDDLTTPDCQELPVPKYPPSPQESSKIFYDFGNKWRVDGERYRMLFQENKKPIYNPLRFSDPPQRFVPVFDPFLKAPGQEELIFKRTEVKATCQGSFACEFDYMVTGKRDIALDTLSLEKKNEGLKKDGEYRFVSCGPLQKSEGAVKYPPGNNYLDGVTVTFSCKPEYFLHGDQQRTCANGSWSPGWWVWCRNRDEETALKWLTGILTSLAIIGGFVLIFSWCYCLRMRRERANKEEVMYRVIKKVESPAQVAGRKGGSKSVQPEQPQSNRNSSSSSADSSDHIYIPRQPAPQPQQQYYVVPEQVPNIHFLQGERVQFRQVRPISSGPRKETLINGSNGRRTPTSNTAKNTTASSSRSRSQEDVRTPASANPRTKNSANGGRHRTDETARFDKQAHESHRPKHRSQKQ